MIKTNREAFPAILRFNHSNDSTMKKATTLFLALTASLLIGATAQIYEPIRWHVEQKPTGNGTADLYLRATIERGMDINDAAKLVRFRLSLGSNFFMSILRLTRNSRGPRSVFT